MSIKKKCLFTAALLCLIATFYSCSCLISDLENARKPPVKEQAAELFTYTVKHFQQNLTDDEYTEVTEDAEILSGEEGAVTVAQPKEYKGFTAQEITQLPIAGDGSTVINIYYDRNSYTVSFETNGADELNDITVRAGTIIAQPSDIEKNYYLFDGWFKDSGCTQTFDFANTSIFENTKLYAKWLPGPGAIAKAAIVIDGIAYDKTEEVYVIPPTKTAYIEGKDPEYIPENASNDYKGAFRAGRKIILDSFIMSKYQVTQELYEAVMKDQIINGNAINAKPSSCNGSSYYPLVTGEEQKWRPVDSVSWYDAVLFCNVLSEKTGLSKAYSIEIINSSYGYINSAEVTLIENSDGYRLPTEAEWEFAARGGDPSAEAWDFLFSGSPSNNNNLYDNVRNKGIDKVGWCSYNTSHGGVTGNESFSSGKPGCGTHQVGLKDPNTLGIYDMSGNVWEWCYDYNIKTTYDDDDPVTFPVGEIEHNPTGPETGDWRVHRGGSWYYSSNYCSVYYRITGAGSTYTSHGIGFRIVRSVPASE